MQKINKMPVYVFAIIGLIASVIGYKYSLGWEKQRISNSFYNEAEKIVIECLQAMDTEFREILVLRDVECLSYEEVGSITGLAPGTVKSRLHRARSLLKSQVEERLGGKNS